MTENSLITKVLYDYQAFDMQTHGGISRCICELYKQLPDTVQATFGIEETDNVYLNQLGFPAQGTAYRHFLSKNNFPLKKPYIRPITISVAVIRADGIRVLY